MKIRINKALTFLMVNVIFVTITALNIYAVPRKLDYSTLEDMYSEQKSEKPDYDTLEDMYLELESKKPDYDTLENMYSEQIPDYNSLKEKYSAQTDTAESKPWYEEAVKYVTENGIMYETSEGEFSPNDEVSRAMFVTILYRISDNKVTTAKTSFTDLDERKYYYTPVIWGYSRGIISGVDKNETKFEPNTAITREQLITILYRYSRYASYDNVDIEFDEKIQSFEDYDEISKDSLKPMKWAYTNGFIQGRGDKLAPNDTVSRAETAVIIKRYIDKYES